MEEDQKDKIITEEFFKKKPFKIRLQKGELTQDILDKIYEKSNSFKKELTDFEIPVENGVEKYDISFNKIEKEYLHIKFSQNQKVVNIFRKFLDPPKNVIIDIDNINIKTLRLYTKEAYAEMQKEFSTNFRYIFIDNLELNTIRLKSRALTIPENIIDIYLNMNDNYKSYNTAIILDRIEIDPLFLSSNFYDIFPEVEKTTNFELILNDKRKILLNKLKSFLESDKNYYWLIGSDGIGKSISLLYFSSLKDYQIIYFNLKLYVISSEKDKFLEIFLKDIHKLFLKDIDYKEYIDGVNFNFAEQIKDIEFEVNKKSITYLSFFWDYLYYFIKINLQKDYIIILDQYKSGKYDLNFNGLNRIINLIRQYNDKKTKIIITSSMDNTDTKYELIKRLDNIFNIEENENLFELIPEIDFNNNSEENFQISSNIDEEEEETNIQFEDTDDLDNKSDCSFCQTIINEEQNKLKKKNTIIEEEKIIINSKCLLDQIFSKKIQRDYYCSLVSGKEIYEKLLIEDEYIVAKDFNYSLKYILKYLYFKKRQSNNGNNDINEIIKEFYKKESDKMKIKIENFYSSLPQNIMAKDIAALEFKSLCKLRNYIVNECKLEMKDLSSELYYFPMKYLNIVLFSFNDNYFSLNQDLSRYKYKIQYNNNFSRIQINCIINDIFKSITNYSLNSFGGSALGNFLEIKIDENFRNEISNKFGFYKYHCRYLFSLVENTKNSSKTIQDHRKNERNLITQFFGEQNYNIIIDDIDDIKNFKLNEDLYYFSQISFTARSFDMAILKKERDNTYTLFLFQVSKNKKYELKSKIYYIIEANNVSNNLEKIYDIEIKRRYLTFILPENISSSDFQSRLQSENLNYVFFNPFTNKFLDKVNKTELFYLELEGSLLDYNPNLNLSDLKNIIRTNNIWEKSIKKYLKKKKNLLIIQKMKKKL